ncbi:phage major capsid protein [Mesorhizobium sp. DCY119]|uniref:phage major capsid protein n=1 Tax=Mesorhizobium sp. DCY119 TaxID=2108445 RepID=UPI0013C4B075|nr:phage major capsid protein [Mesorhizobium sp. DCY119]
MKHRITKGALSVTDEGVITGLAWLFDEPDRYGDTIEKGALSFPDTLPILWSHKDENAIGVWESIKETARGIEVRGRLLLEEVPLAKQVFALIKSGGVKSLSVGFWPLKSDKNATGGQHISDGDLVEISIVSAPAHPGATITSIKSAAGGKDTKRMAKAALKTKAEDDQIDDAANDNNEVTLEDRVAALETDVAEIKDTINGTSDTVEEMSKSLKTIVAKSGRPGVVRAPAEKPEDMQKKAFGAYLRKGEHAPETKSLIRSNDAKGGYLAPPEFAKELIREIVEYSPIRENAHVGSTGNASVVIPGRVGRTNAKWKGETETQEESTFDFEEQEIAIHEVNTYVDVSWQLLEDAEIDVEAEIRTAFAEDIGGKETQAFLFGTGVKQPSGFMVDPRVAEFASGAASTVDSDALIAFLYSMPAVYRKEGSWLMNGDTLGKLRTLKDDNGVYIWRPGLAEGQPETILGRPVVEAIDMPDVEAGAFPIVFGDLKQAYRIYDRIDIEVLANQYLLATNSQTRFHLRKRLGGGVVRPLAIKKLKIGVS